MRGIVSRPTVTLLAVVVVLGVCQAGRAQIALQPLCVMNSDGSDMHEVAAVPADELFGSPDWSADGKFIAYDVYSPSLTGQHVFVVELATGEITDLGRGGFPSFAPDSERVAFHRYQQGAEVWVVNRDGSDAKLMFGESSHPRWSRDGKLISYRGRRGDNIGIYDVESGERRELFDEPTDSLHWGRSFSPDGKRLALTRAGPGGADELVLISTESTSRGMKVRYRGDMSSHASWSADGSQILVGLYLPGDGPRHLHFVTPDSRKRPMLVPGQDPRYDYCDGTFSPDGKQVAFGLKQRPMQTESGTP